MSRLTTKQRALKARAKKYIARISDVLAMRATFAQKHYAMGALQTICWKAGKDATWTTNKISDLFDRNEITHQFDLQRRVAMMDGAS